METPASLNPIPASEKSAASNVLAPVSSATAEIVTRDRLPGTRLGEKHKILKRGPGIESGIPGESITTRDPASIRRRRRKKILTGIAIALAFFPPMWAIYFITWLFWRNRPPQKSMGLVRKAIRALEKGQTGVALKQLQEAHYLNPANNDALYWLGLLLNQQHRHEEAAEALSLVSERVPGLPEVESALVEAHVAMNEPEGAIYHAQRLLDVAPHAPETLLKLADAFEAADRFDLAIQALEQAPLHKRVLTGALVPIHYRLGVLYDRQGNIDQALYHFERVYARDIAYKDIRTRVTALKAGQKE